MSDKKGLDKQVEKMRKQPTDQQNFGTMRPKRDEKDGAEEKK